MVACPQGVRLSASSVCEDAGLCKVCARKAVVHVVLPCSSTQTAWSTTRAHGQEVTHRHTHNTHLSTIATRTHTPVNNCHLLCLFEGEGDVVLSLSPQSWTPSWETRSVTLLVGVDRVQLQEASVCVCC